MFGASQKIIPDNYSGYDFWHEYRLSIVCDNPDGPTVSSSNYNERWLAVRDQRPYLGMSDRKVLIHNLWYITKERTDSGIKEYDGRNIDSVKNEIVRSYFYRGYRIDVTDVGSVYILRPNWEGKHYKWKIIKGRILDHYRYRVEKALDLIDITLFNEHKSWIRMYLCYSTCNYDRHYCKACTDIETAEQYGRLSFEEIEVPPTVGDKLFYVEWFVDTYGIFMVNSRHYEETGDVYFSIAAAKTDDIWKRMESFMKLRKGDFEFYVTDTMIATDVGNRPFQKSDIRRTYGTRADIKSIPVIWERSFTEERVE